VGGVRQNLVQGVLVGDVDGCLQGAEAVGCGCPGEGFIVPAVTGHADLAGINAGQQGVYCFALFEDFQRTGVEEDDVDHISPQGAE
jgi:hypothetical protein